MTSIFGSRPTVTPAPTPTAPAPMPDSQSPAVLEANKAAQQAILNRAGRSSTILTAPQNRGSGGDSYSSKTLGAAN